MSQSQPIDTATRQDQGDEVSLGRELRRARELRGVTLQQASEETRIGIRHLRALEADALGELPGRLYGRNFVRSYGEYLGAEEAELLAHFDHQCRQADLAADPGKDVASGQGRLLVTGAFSLAALVMVTVLAWSWYVKNEADAPAPDENLASAEPVAASTAAASGREKSATARIPVPPEPVVEAPSRPAATLEKGAAKPAEKPVAERVEAAAEPQPPQPEAAPARRESATGAPGASSVVELGSPPEPEPEVTEVPAEAPKPRPPAPEKKPEKPAAPVVKLEFTAPCWLEVTKEGADEPIFGLKSKGDQLSFSLEKPMMIKVFNAGGVRLTIDGQEARALGGESEARTIHLDSKNWRAFLR